MFSKFVGKYSNLCVLRAFQFLFRFIVVLQCLFCAASKNSADSDGMCDAHKYKYLMNRQMRSEKQTFLTVHEICLVFCLINFRLCKYEF